MNLVSNKLAYLGHGVPCLCAFVLLSILLNTAAATAAAAITNNNKVQRESPIW